MFTLWQTARSGGSSAAAASRASRKAACSELHVHAAAWQVARLQCGSSSAMTSALRSSSDALMRSWTTARTAAAWDSAGGLQLQSTVESCRTQWMAISQREVLKLERRVGDVCLLCAMKHIELYRVEVSLFF